MNKLWTVVAVGLTLIVPAAAQPYGGRDYGYDGRGDGYRERDRGYGDRDYGDRDHGGDGNVGFDERVVGQFQI